MNRKIKNFAASLLLSLTLLTIAPVSVAMAASSKCDVQPAQTVVLFPAWYDGLLCKDGNIKSPADTSLGSDTGKQFGTWLTIIAMNIVRMLLYIVGYVSLIFIIWGGFKYMTQGDNSSGTVAARKTIQNAIIGLVISIMSIAIVQFIAGSIK